MTFQASDFSGFFCISLVVTGAVGANLIGYKSDRFDAATLFEEKRDMALRRRVPIRFERSTAVATTK